MSDKLTQCKQIVAYIREKGCITSLEAYQKLKVTQLAARITDLESLGFVFNKPRFKVGNCKNPITHYSIAESGFEPWYVEDEGWWEECDDD
mgnify:CR=1 FL=1